MNAEAAVRRADRLSDAAGGVGTGHSLQAGIGAVVIRSLYLRPASERISLRYREGSQ